MFSLKENRLKGEYEKQFVHQAQRATVRYLALLKGPAMRVQITKGNALEFRLKSAHAPFVGYIPGGANIYWRSQCMYAQKKRVGSEFWMYTTYLYSMSPVDTFVE